MRFSVLGVVRRTPCKSEENTANALKANRTERHSKLDGVVPIDPQP